MGFENIEIPLRVAGHYWLLQDPKKCVYGVRVDAWVRLCAVLMLQVGKAKAATALSELTSLQMGSLGNQKVFGQVLTKKVMALIMLAPLDLVYEWVLRGLRLQWSKHLTNQLLNRFVDLNVCNFVNEEERNDLDQHVAEDVDKFVDLFLDLFLEMVQATIHLWFFTGVLARSSKFLSRSTVTLAGFGTFLTLVIGRQLPKLYRAERESSNAFRYALTRVRENAESIAFYNGQEQEIENIKDRYVTKHQDINARKYKRDIIKMISSTYRKITGLLPFVVLARMMNGSAHDHEHHHHHHHNHHDKEEEEHLQHSSDHNHSHSHGHSHVHGHGHSHGGASHGHDVSGMEHLGRILQASEAFDEILYHLMIIAENMNDFTRLKTAAEHIDNIMKCEVITPKMKQENGLDICVNEISHPKPLWLEINGLTVKSRGLTLIEDLELKLEQGKTLLIVGESGIGKTTLLRAIQGLYKQGWGQITRPLREEILFIPQQPYMTLGSLREQLFYPTPREQITKTRDEELIHILELVGLDKLLERHGSLDAYSKWPEELSVGEQQRLAFGRILVTRPTYCFLDESTSACDLGYEDKMYTLLKEKCKSYVSVGHRKSIEAYHDYKLILKRDGVWALEPLHS